MITLTDIAQGLGRLTGEIAHQTDKAYEGTKSLSEELIDDIKNIPEAFSKGYDEELFETTKDEPIKTKEENRAGNITT